MKKVITLFLVLAVMLSCLPLGMVSYAASVDDMPTVEETPLLKRFVVSSDAIIKCSEKSPWWASCAFDGKYGYITSEGNVSTDNNFFESDRGQPWYVGADFNLHDSTPKYIRKIRYLPRFEFADRMNDAWFEGSNDGVTYTPICEKLSGHRRDNQNKDWDGPNGWFTIDLPDNTTAYRYVRLRREQVVNVSEIEFYIAAGAGKIVSDLAAQIDTEILEPYNAAGVTVQKTLPSLPPDAEGYTLSYSVGEGSTGAVVNGNTATYTLSDDMDLTASINVTVTNSSNSADTQTIPVSVTLKQNISDTARVQSDKEKIEAAFKEKVGETTYVISGYMDLPTETQYGTTVEWSVSGDNAGAVTFEDNRLLSKDITKDAKTVTLKATVSINDVSETLTYNDVTVNSGLQIWYKFDTESVDESANTVANSGYNTAIDAATLEKGATAIPDVGENGAVYLKKSGNNRETQHVKMPPNIVANIDGDYTISLMIYKDGSDGWPLYIGSRGQNVGSPAGSPWIGILNNGKCIYNQAGANNGNIVIDPRSNHSGAWKNIMLSNSGGTVTMYVDGESKGTATIPYKLSEKFADQPKDAWNFLGACGWRGDAGYTGFIGDFRIYSRALSQTEAMAVSAAKPNAVYPDWQKVALGKSALTLAQTENLTENITLPTSVADNDSTISWQTSDASVIGVDGTIHPGDSVKSATLTATITNGTASTTKSFAVTVAKSGGAVASAEADKDWLNIESVAETHYDYAANTVDAKDVVVMKLPKSGPMQSAIAWTYDGKATGATPALFDRGDYVELHVQKSIFADVSKNLKATITNGTASVEYTKTVTANRIAEQTQITIPACANAHTGTAKQESKSGEVYNYLLTTKAGQIYFKFDLAGLKEELAAQNKKIVKAELKAHHGLGSAPRYVVIREVADGWTHNAHFGARNWDGQEIPEESRIPEPEVIEVASAGNTPKQKDFMQFDLTSAFLNGFADGGSTYCLALTNYNTDAVDWPYNNSGAASIDLANPDRWTRLVLTLADSNAEASAAYAEITKDKYNLNTMFGDKKLATGVATQLPVASIEIDNPDYTAPVEGEEPAVPEKITLNGSWYGAFNCTIDGRRNTMAVNSMGEDTILTLNLEGYTRCFTLSKDIFVDYQYKKEDMPSGGIKLIKADNAGEGFLYTAVYESNKLIWVERVDLSEATWSGDNTYTYVAPTLTTGQTVKYYLWNENLVPYL